MTTATLERPTMRLQLPPLHPSQQLIAKDPHRFKVVCCGRRWGKGVLGITIATRAGLKGGRIWWVAPTYKVALEGWLYLMLLVRKMPMGLAKVEKGELIVRFAGGGSIQIRTGDDPDNLRGAGLDGVVIDEAATLKPATWTQALRPALADKQGWAIFISTPKHFNWFYDLWHRALDGVEDWASWTFPTWDNPFIPEAEIDAARRDMLPEDFDQEFGASFTAVGGAIFRLLATNRQRYLRPMPSGLEVLRTGVGMDWGTTPEHQAAVVSGSLLRTGAVWIRSSWLDHSGSSDAWRGQAGHCKKDYGATFAWVDRSQSSELDRLKVIGFTPAKGNPAVDVRIGETQSLILGENLFFDSTGPGVPELYNHAASYHRDQDGKVVEEEDDDVDALCYLISGLVGPVKGPAATRAVPVSYKKAPRRPGRRSKPRA